MTKNSILTLLLGLILGGVITAAVTLRTPGATPPAMDHTAMQMPGMQMSGASHTMTGMSMQDMVTSLGGKTGDDFDKAFLTGMIAHHEGAVVMAKEAQQSAKHDEIKTLADGIIAAQQKEIAEMHLWETQWGYTQ